MNPFKSLRHVSRYETSLDFGCESFSRPMKKLFVSLTLTDVLNSFIYIILLKPYLKLNYTMKIKPDTANNFRQIIQITNLDLCAALEDLSRISLVSEYLELVNKVFPGALHKCPYTVTFKNSRDHEVSKQFFSHSNFITEPTDLVGMFTTLRRSTLFRTDSSDTRL